MARTLGSGRQPAADRHATARGRGAQPSGAGVAGDTADVRARIVDAALAVLRTEGVGQFTQVRVAARAGVRQSHLTYYFPTRPALLEATAAAFVDGVTGGIARAAGGAGVGSVLAQLARAIADRGHMRMFVGVGVEAEADPAVRAILLRGTERITDALAAAIGGPQAAARARAVLATLWGLGFYEFVVRPTPAGTPERAVLDVLEGVLDGSIDLGDRGCR